MNLAKSPASTIQIIGAEKALFRALKTKHDTPKYGLIYHASLIGQATGKNKGKIARMLATKAALGLRVDALSDWGTTGENAKPEPSEEEKMQVGVQGRLMVERRLRGLEGKPLRREGVAIGPGGQAQQTQPSKWSVKEARKYNPDADGLAGDEAAAAAPAEPAPAVNGKALVREVSSDEDEDMEDADEGAGEELITKTKLNGDAEREPTKENQKQAKQAKKDEKAKRKLEKAEKKAKKEAKKAGKETTADGESTLTNGDSKKRKRDVDGEAKGEKKKKKKSKDA